MLSLRELSVIAGFIQENRLFHGEGFKLLVISFDLLSTKKSNRM